MKEIRIHGRGGQGGVTLAELIAHAAINEGRYAQSFPAFGPERRGAPVDAFIRVHDELIRERAGIRNPDDVVVLDPTLLGTVNVTAGLKLDGTLILNTRRSADEIRLRYNLKHKLATLDAMTIARECIGRPIVNTSMAGALLKVTNIVKPESLEEPMKEYFGERAKSNMEAMQKAYEQTKVW
jgi:pyruvate ferredoxin oxidoreductase gamma subunit